MKDTVRLGRLGGVPVGLNWSLLVVVGLLAFGLANGRFPHDAPGYQAGSYATAGAASALVLLICVLLHELGHAFVARRAGLTVDGITLSWMGGVTRLEGDAPRPRAELAIAAIGPGVSLALGGLLWLGRMLVHGAGNHRLLLAALGWLAVINVVLAVFNLFPAAPLDGGRVLHALAWSATGSRLRATRISSRSGLALGLLVIAAGVFEGSRGSGGADGLFIILLGWWLLAAARAEERAAVIHDALDGMRMVDLMRPVAAAPGWVTLESFVERYASAHPGWVWLLEGWGGGYGAVISGDAVAAVPRDQWSRLRPLDVGVPVAAAAGAAPTDRVLDVLGRTEGKQVVLVIEGDHTVGAVLPADIEARLRPRRRWQSAPRRVAADAGIGVP